MHYAARGSVLFSVAAGLLISSLPAHAQQTDTGVGIAAVSGGGIFGLGAHGSAGASLTSPVSKYLAPFIDFSYSPLTSYAFTYGANLTGKGLYTSSLLDVNGGLKIRFPNKSDWVPYIGLGAGLLRLSSSTIRAASAPPRPSTGATTIWPATPVRVRFITSRSMSGLGWS